MGEWTDAELSRRVLLRRVLAAGAALAASAVLASCTAARLDPGPTGGAGNRAQSGEAAKVPTIPQELATIPQGFSSPAGHPGTLAELHYETYESMAYEQQGQRLTKRAIVYLPYGYADTEQYDVFYLMHGGWSDETTTLGTPDNPSTFKNVFDNAIAAGEIAPLIIVCPTYNNTSPDDSADFSLALTLTQNYHHELLNDLIPAVESRYSTHADDVSLASIEASRDHRGFGGFSMGAVTTWRAFQYGLDSFRYFLPMSCGTALDMDNILSAAGARDPSDYFVWIITGTEDFARSDDEARIAVLRDSRYFTESDSEQDGNFAFRVKPGYAHDATAAAEYTYNGLQWFWTGRL